MINVSKTPSGKWFLEEKNSFPINDIPKKVLNNLSRLSEDQIYELAVEMISFRLGMKLAEYNKNNETKIEDMEDFQVLYQKDNFPDFENKDEMLSYMVDKTEAILNVLVSSNEEYWSVDSDMCVYEIVECQTSLIKNKSRNSQGLRMDRAVKNAVDIYRNKNLQSEKSYSELLEQACMDDDYESFKILIGEMSTMQERITVC